MLKNNSYDKRIIHGLYVNSKNGIFGLLSFKHLKSNTICINRFTTYNIYSFSKLASNVRFYKFKQAGHYHRFYRINSLKSEKEKIYTVKEQSHRLCLLNCTVHNDKLYKED